jgi:hypothetical protein
VRRALAGGPARFLPGRAEAVAQSLEFAAHAGQLVGERQHGLVLFGHVAPQVGMALLQPGQAFNITHGRDNAYCRPALKP